MRALYRLLAEHEEAVEADLSRYHHREYTDRWRLDERGRPLLTLREIRVRLRYLPPQSATGQALGLDTGWRVGDYLLADVYHALTGKKHPAKPNPKKSTGAGASRQTPARAAKLAAARRRKVAREAQIARGELGE